MVSKHICYIVATPNESNIQKLLTDLKKDDPKLNRSLYLDIFGI